MNMILLTIELERSVSESMTWLGMAALGAFLVLHYVFRHLNEGLLGVARTGVALLGGATVYLGGIKFILPWIPFFFMPDSLVDGTVPKRLRDVLEEQHSVLEDLITIADRTADALCFVCLLLLVQGCTFLHRMREGQKEHLRLTRLSAESKTTPET